MRSCSNRRIAIFELTVFSGYNRRIAIFELTVFSGFPEMDSDLRANRLLRKLSQQQTQNRSFMLYILSVHVNTLLQLYRGYHLQCYCTLRCTSSAQRRTPQFNCDFSMPTFTSGAFEEQNEAIRYLDELVRDMRKLNAIQRTSPLLFLHARYLLTTEMDRIWTVIYRRNLYQLSPSYLAPQNYYPSRHYMSEDEMITLQEKVEIPQKTGYNYICRILGPRGKTVRRLEAETGCHILIRGEGSLK
ncbi:unnamed protein product, partial [Anisakis simplex]|uniref:KH_dom_type_1 domain-containing protein n=1 Tax=Anisakis simplex TaxID=6269 RepID=A0A0M3J2I6_ANISI